MNTLVTVTHSREPKTNGGNVNPDFMHFEPDGTPNGWGAREIVSIIGPEAKSALRQGGFGVIPSPAISEYLTNLPHPDEFSVREEIVALIGPVALGRLEAAGYEVGPLKAVRDKFINS